MLRCLDEYHIATVKFSFAIFVRQVAHSTEDNPMALGQVKVDDKSKEITGLALAQDMASAAPDASKSSLMG